MKTLAPSVVTVRDPKGLKFVSVVESIYNKAKLSEEEAQRVNETPGLTTLVAGFIKKNRSITMFASEEIESIYGYLSGYTKPGMIITQTNRLRELFPGLGYTNQDLCQQIGSGEVKLPENAEGWFAIPNWNKNPKIFGETYSSALQKVLEAIKQAHNGKFCNDCEDCLDRKCLRQLARTDKFFRQHSKAQDNPDILIVPAQFGIRHRGRSVGRARAVMNSQEFGLGAFAVGCMLLTHLERLQQDEDLRIDCAGDEIDPGDGGGFLHAPYFAFEKDRVKLDESNISSGGQFATLLYYGTASGFLIQ